MPFISNAKREKLTNSIRKHGSQYWIKFITLVSLISSFVVALFVCLEFTPYAIDEIFNEVAGGTPSTTGWFTKLFVLICGNDTVGQNVSFILLVVCGVVSLIFGLLTIFLIPKLKSQAKVLEEVKTLLKSPLSGKKGSVAANKHVINDRMSTSEEIREMKAKTRKVGPTATKKY